MQGRTVTVLYTKPGPTMAALAAARRLAWPGGDAVRLVAAMPVPYPLPLSTPAVAPGFKERQLRGLASQSSVTTRVEVYWCRDRRDVLRDHLAPGSLVVLGAGFQSWWGLPYRGLVRWLQRHGHCVVLAPPDKEAGKRRLQRNLLQFRMPNSSH